MKLWKILKNRKSSRGGHKRFFTLRDMAEIKHDAAKKNARIKRGEQVDHPNNVIYECGCGHEGCFLHVGYGNPNEKGERQY